MTIKSTAVRHGLLWSLLQVFPLNRENRLRCMLKQNDLWLGIICPQHMRSKRFDPVRGIQDEEGQAVKEWSIYLAVSIFLWRA
ncbi:hypothetical protein QKW52_01915 [Bacillus sonorensis]|nr:hypothetical protein [Bacillus sonorensis]